jgi:hypothetical protein
MTRRLDELEQDVEQTRARLDQTIGALQERLSISGLADDFIGSLRKTQLGSVVEAALDVVKRNPVPVILVAAGVGWLAHRLNKEARGYASYRRIDDEPVDIPVLNTGNARVYDPDVSPRHPTQDALESRREASARV